MKTAWPCAPLGDLCDVQIGKTPPRAEQRFWGDDHRWLSIADMNQGRELRVTAERVSQEAVDELNLRPVQPGTVLLSFKLSIGKVGIASVPLFTNEAIAHLPIRSDSLDRDYLYWALRAVPLTGDADRAAMGSTLNKAKLQVIPIPLPPMEEQRRIAAVLDAADALRAKRRQALAKLDTLTQAIFIDMFGPSVGPHAAANDSLVRQSGFPVQPLGEVADFLDHMRRPITASDRVPGPIPYYGANGKQDEVADFIFDEPLVLLAEDGGHFDEPARGVAYSIDGKSWVNNHAHVLRPRSMVTRDYLTAYLRQQHLAKFLSGTTRAKLTKTSACSIPVPVPPLERQQSFVAATSIVARQVGLQAHQRAEFEDLFASLQQRAFRGEL